MGLFDWTSKWRLPKASLEAQAQAIAAALGALGEVQTLNQTGSSALATALQRLVPQLASLTIGTYDRKTGERAKDRLHRRLNYDISDVCTGYEFWAAFFQNLLEHNNAFAYFHVAPSDTGAIVLRPLPAPLVTVTKPEPVAKPWRVAYEWNGKPLPASNVWHVRLNAADGVKGRSWKTDLAVFELSRAAESLAYQYFANGGQVERIWKYAGIGTDGKGGATRQQVAAQQALLNEILTRQGPSSGDYNGNVIVPSYFDYKDAPRNLREAQLHESRTFHRDEILALYGIDPAKPSDLESLYTVSLVPILEAVEQSIARNLLTAAQRGRWKVSYVTEGRFRGAVNTWMATLADAVQALILTPNEARRMVSLGLPDTEGGDVLMNPHTMPAAVSDRRDAIAAGGQAKPSDESPDAHAGEE